MYETTSSGSLLLLNGTGNHEQKSDFKRLNHRLLIESIYDRSVVEADPFWDFRKRELLQ